MISAVIDSQVFAMQRHGGIGRYFVELLKHSDAFRQKDIALITPYRRVLNNQAAADLPERFQMLPNNGFKMRAALVTARALQSRVVGRGDVIHHTYYDRRFLAPKKHRSHVCTVYDMIPEKFPEMFPQGNPHGGKRTFVDQSDGIIAISHQTKADLVEIYGIPESRVAVISLGVSGEFSPGDPAEATEGKPFVLFVGRRSGYKNFQILVEALAHSKAITGDLDLVAVGGGPLLPEENAFIREHGMSHRVKQSNVPEDALLGLYRRAVAFVFPSKYEGFGLPALEAMASGCPTILASAGSFPEVGGQAALYFDPTNEEELIGGLTTLVQDTAARASLRAAGLSRAEEFSWRTTAEKTASLYASV